MELEQLVLAPAVLALLSRRTRQGLARRDWLIEQHGGRQAVDAHLEQGRVDPKNVCVVDAEPPWLFARGAHVLERDAVRVIVGDERPQTKVNRTCRVLKHVKHFARFDDAVDARDKG